ncbi:MAG: diphthine synthase [Candidatus Aenigmarchaeota archaeon]|nr:diphthine synthase [Candidatus Aenigmarchaeota archaeon]
MLYLISIGLHDEKDMSLKALEAAKKCDMLYAEFYTNKMNTTVNRLSALIGKNVTELKRPDLEENSDKIISEARNKNVGILVGGDALSATTHISLILDAKKKGTKAQVIHGSSILTAVAETGLQLYKFGRTTTLAFPEKNYFPTSAYDVVLENKKGGLHTLILLDVKPGKGMTLKEGIGLLMEMERQKNKGLFDGKTRLVAASGFGGRAEIRYNSMENLLKDKSIGMTPAVLICPGELHFMEKECLESL